MAVQEHLEIENVDRGYYVDEETGEFLGESVEDIDLDNHRTYRINAGGNIVRECQSCGYEGPRYHPRRDKPTNHPSSTMYKHCPNTDCQGVLDSN